jgi:bifunctional non-homologous end joining protein LigD
VGNAGSGLSDADLRRWTEELGATRIPTSPFDDSTRSHRALRDAAWVEPAHVVQVAFTEWTTEGRLRQPSVLGRRLDVDVDDVRCVDEVAPPTTP